MEGGEKDPSNISAAVQDKKKLLMATHMFSEFGSSTELWLNFPELTGSPESKMVIDKTEVLRTQVLS